MKAITVIILNVLICFQINAQKRTSKPVFNESDSTYIDGKITGYKPGAGDDFISFTIYDVTGNENQKSVQLSRDGSFNVSFYQPYKGDISLNYKDAFVSIYTEPGKKLTILIENDKINSNTSNKNAFAAKGNKADLNNLLFDFQTQLGQHKFVSKPDFADKTQTDSIFAQKGNDLIQEKRAFLNSYVKLNHIHNPIFERWQTNQFIYSIATDVIIHPFSGKISNITQTQLIKFISRVPIVNYEALNSSAYYKFLNTLTTSAQIIINTNVSYSALIKANGNNPLPLYMDKIDSVATGKIKEIMYYCLFQSGTKATNDEILSRVNSVIDEPYFANFFKERLSTKTTLKSYDIITRLKRSNVSDTLKSRLIAIFEKEKGTNLYIDFWGEWCSPCMSEMPGYPKLIAKLEGKPINFIFFSAFTSEKHMLAVKEKNKINGEFINLTKNEVAIMSNVFNINVYPSHFIVNTTGQVVGGGTKDPDVISKLLGL